MNGGGSMETRGVRFGPLADILRRSRHVRFIQRRYQRHSLNVRQMQIADIRSKLVDLHFVSFRDKTAAFHGTIFGKVSLFRDTVQLSR